MTPVEYIKAYRLQAACQMLAKGQEAVTVISHECGLGSSSYFGKVFREYTHCSPTEYRRKWQNSDEEGRPHLINPKYFGGVYDGQEAGGRLTAEGIAYLEECYVPHPIVGAIDKNPAQGVMLLDEKK